MRVILGAVLVAVAGTAGCGRPQDGPVAAPDGGSVCVCAGPIPEAAVVAGPVALVAADVKPEAGKPFELPADAAGQLLAGVLPPVKRPGALEDPTRPARTAAAPRTAGLEPTLAEVPGPSPRRPAAGKAPRPHTVTDEALDEGFGPPVLPARPRFSPGERAKEPSERAEVPPPLPYLATAPQDRVSVDDPTLEASTAAVLAGAIPERTVPLPFVRLSVPDPYEWRIPLLTVPPEEPTTPRGPTPTKP